jgi:cobalt/nickel transport protein
MKISGNWLMVAGVVVLCFGPLLALQGNNFGATDGNNSNAIQEIQPDYKPWFQPVIKDSGPEVQTFLFATQAGIGAGVTGYILGLYKGRSQQRKRTDESSN